VIEKQAAQTAVPPSLFVTVTAPAPRLAAADTDTLAVSWVDDTNVVEFTVTPLAEKTADAPVANPVPAIVTF
jgi:hypothetical protein